jgi:hypothetical protein
LQFQIVSRYRDVSLRAQYRAIIEFDHDIGHGEGRCLTGQECDAGTQSDEIRARGNRVGERALIGAIFADK